jgi:hypothetical protein
MRPVLRKLNVCSAVHLLRGLLLLILRESTAVHGSQYIDRAKQPQGTLFLLLALQYSVDLSLFSQGTLQKSDCTLNP